MLKNAEIWRKVIQLSTFKEFGEWKLLQWMDDYTGSLSLVFARAIS